MSRCSASRLCVDDAVEIEIACALNEATISTPAPVLSVFARSCARAICCCTADSFSCNGSISALNCSIAAS